MEEAWLLGIDVQLLSDQHILSKWHANFLIVESIYLELFINSVCAINKSIFGLFICTFSLGLILGITLAN